MLNISSRLVRDAITLALRGAFPRNIINAEVVPQGLEPGVLYVALVSNHHDMIISPLYLDTAIYNVVYHPKNGASECLDVTDRLTDALQFITTSEGGSIHGVDMNSRIEDGVLQFMVTYNYHVRRYEGVEYMETLELTGGVYG